MLMNELRMFITQPKPREDGDDHELVQWHLARIRPGSSAGDHREDGHFVLRGQGGRKTARELDVSSVDQEDHHRAHGSLVEHGIAECGPVANREHFQETGDVREVVVELVGVLPRELAKRREILDAHRSSSIRFAGGGPGRPVS